MDNESQELRYYEGKSKMSIIEKGIASEIIKLHNEILGLGRTCLEKAVRIGRLLIEQKAALKHGEFTDWIESNLPFTDRTARNYMRLYENRDLLKTENVSNLQGAYRLLSGESIEAKVKRLKREIAEARTIEKLNLIQSELKRLLSQNGADILDAEAYLGELLKEIKSLVPVMIEVKGWAQGFIGQLEAILSGGVDFDLPDKEQADCKNTLTEVRELLRDCEYGLSVAARAA